MVKPKDAAVVEIGNFNGIITLTPQQHWDAEYRDDEVRVSHGNVVLFLNDDEFHRWFREVQ